jgi:glycosyltransferase involved in cell wall biosynthesis
MRITMVMGPFYPMPPVLGGAVEKVHFLLASEFRAAGHEVTIISRKFNDFPENETVDGVRHARIATFERSSSLVVNLVLSARYALRAARCLPRSDITITNVFLLPLLLPRARAGKIYVHVARYPKHQMLLYWRADRLQAISRAIADEIARQAPSLSSKIVTIGYPVADDYFCSNSPQPREKIILYVGRIAREKGLDILIRSFASMLKRKNPADLSEWVLRIVGPHELAQGGDGPEYMNELAALARPVGSACEFTGPIFDQRALIEIYQSASVFVYPSLAETGEALGLAPLEAMAAGCAVIVSNLSCFDDFAEDDQTALRFDHRCLHPEEALAVKLADLIRRPKAIEEIALRGRETAHRFRTSAIVDRMVADFRSLLPDVS